jgi:SAM-dependent methyltransferase
MTTKFDRYSQSYDASVNSALSFSGLRVDVFTRVKVDYFIDIIDLLRPPAAQAEVIDIGCGVGNSHPLLRKRVARVVGVDISRASLATARLRNPCNEYREYDGLKLPYPDAIFDAASAVCVFHHILPAMRARLVEDVLRVLRPGGIFAIFEHNPINPLTRHVVNNCEFDKDAVLLRRRESEALLKAAGFVDVETRFILAVPPLGFILRKVDRLFKRVPFGAQYVTAGRADACGSGW